MLRLATAALALALPAAAAARRRSRWRRIPSPAATSCCVTGSAGDCPAGDAVTILSHAFVHTHDFAGVPAVYARVRAGGAFHVSTRIPATRKPGAYTVTARCGGGNLGVLKHLRVRS